VALFLCERDVEKLGSMPEAIDAIREVFLLSGQGRVCNPPRQRVDLSQGALRLTTAVVPSLERMAVKVSSTTVFKSNSGRLLILSDSKSGRILAFLEVFQMGALRTGAASGVATDLLARRDARTVGIFGSGRQARTQLWGVASVRGIERASVISPDPSHVASFCAEMSARLKFAVVAARSADEIYGADIIITATTAQQPVLLGRHLKPGTHVNAIGSNLRNRCELDEEAMGKFALIAVDNREQAKQESAELIGATERGIVTWDTVHEIGEVAAGIIAGRQEERDMTLFKSLGVAMEDVALGARLYDLARARGVGIEVPLTEE
jgi:alanine dehydrogenase